MGCFKDDSQGAKSILSSPITSVGAHAREENVNDIASNRSQVGKLYESVFCYK